MIGKSCVDALRKVTGDDSIETIVDGLKVFTGDDSIETIADGLEKALDGGGGGGSSDLTTAQVTLVASKAGAKFVGAIYTEGGGMAATMGYQAVNSGQSTTVTCVLYKGTAAMFVYDGSMVNPEKITSVTGSAEILNGTVAMITGDCTITY